MDSERIGIYSGPRKEMERDWIYCRVLLGGTRALREAGEQFTPKTARERKDPVLYEERLATTVLLNTYEETVNRVASLPFQRPPTIVGTLDPMLERIENDADRMGTSLSVFMSTIYQDAVDRGLGCYLVDNVPTAFQEPEVDQDGEQIMNEDGTPKMRVQTISAMEAEQMDARPYFSRIDPDNLVGWLTEMRSGREVCTELRVREWAYVSDQGIDRLVERIRLYDSENVSLWQRNYSQSTTTTETRELLAGRESVEGYSLIVEPYPHGFPGGVIPIVAVYTRKVGFLHARPPYLGLAHLNIKHWNQQSILDTSIRYNLNPILFGRGMMQEHTETPPKTGEGSAMMTTSETAELRYVEITGASLNVARAEIEKTEMRMGSEAAEPLLAGSATATGEVSAVMREQSEAQRWIEACEWAIYRGYEIAHEWLSKEVPDDFNVTLHRASSVLQVASPARTQALQTDMQSNRLTLATYLKERARSGDFSDDFDPEVEAEAVELEAERRVQRQMDAMANHVIGQRGDGDPPGAPPPAAGGDPPDDETEDDDEVDGEADPSQDDAA